jgi:hypothetical protein
VISGGESRGLESYSSVVCPCLAKSLSFSIQVLTSLGSATDGTRGGEDGTGSAAGDKDGGGSAADAEDGSADLKWFSNLESILESAVSHLFVSRDRSRYLRCNTETRTAVHTEPVV